MSNLHCRHAVEMLSLSGVCPGVSDPRGVTQSDAYSSVSAPGFCSVVTTYFGVMIGTHRLARLWFAFWLLPAICRAVSIQSAQRKAEACDFLTWVCVAVEGLVLFWRGAPRPSAANQCCYLSAVLRSCSQLRVPVRWRGQATAAVVTESTKPQIQPQER